MENLTKYIKWKNSQINSCKKRNFQSLFNIIHKQKGHNFCEYFEKFEKKQISYSDFAIYCKKMASYLKSNLECKRNSFVGIYMENSVDWIATFWGLLMIGYKPLLLNCKLSNDINNQILNIMNCSNVIVNDSATCKLNANNFKVDKQKILLSKKINKCCWANEIGLCTTASSLNYKICVYAGKNMFAQLENVKDVIKKYCPRVKKHYKSRLKLLAFLPLYHIFGLIATYFWFSIFGRTIVFLKDYSSKGIISTIHDFEITHIFSVPLFWNTIANQIQKEIFKRDTKTQERFKKWSKFCLHLQNFSWKLGTKITRNVFKEIISSSLGRSIQFIISGGGYQSDNTMNLFNSIGYPLAIGYGTSEVGIVCFENRNKPKYRLQGCSGKPLKTYHAKIKNQTLWIKGDSTCKYFYYKDGTKVHVNNRWFNTNDIATIDKKGYITILGRQDDVIVSQNGEKINPDVIEKKLFLPNVLNYVIVLLNGQTTLIVQLKEKINQLLINEIITQIKSNVKKVIEQGYTINNVMYTFDPLAPKNAIKVSRKILYDQIATKKINLMPINNLQLKDNLSKSKIYNNLTETIINIVSNVLSKNPKEIGLNDNLIFDLGLTSLDYFTILSNIEEEFGITINFKETSFQTVNAFVKYIKDLKKR